ncbi:MAG: hypothetical protein ACOCTR_05550 [Candidatus Natronoplasma sp.]
MNYKLVYNFPAFLKERKELVKSIFVLSFLVLLTAVLLYPAMGWFITIMGGFISALGVLYKKKSLIYMGLVLAAGIFYMYNLNTPLSLLTISLFSVLFILFYGGAVYIEELVRRDILLRENKGTFAETIDRYKKEWGDSLFRYSVLSFIIALLGSLVIAAGSFDFSTYEAHPITFASSLAFGLLSLSLVYVLILKLPDYLKE